MNGLIRNRKWALGAFAPLSTGRAALAAAIVAFAAPAAMADTATYNINSGNLVNHNSECCDGQHRYNGCSPSTLPKFVWMDTIPAGSTINSVSVQFNKGVDCHSSGSQDTDLNGVSGDTYTVGGSCSCCENTQSRTVNQVPSAYVIGGNNTFTYGHGSNTCIGSNGVNGVFGTVTVDFSGPVETDCTNGADDDQDGLVDCEDDDCADDPACDGGGGGGNIEGKLDAIEVKLDELGGVGSKLDAIEVKLDNFDGSGCDLSGVIGKLDAIEVKLDNLDIGEGIGSKLDAIETKLDDETRFTDDTELGDSTNVVVGEINQNEVKIDALEAKADEAGTSLDALEAKADAAGLALDALEVKADEAGTSLDALEVKADEAGTSLDALEVKADEAATSLDALEAKADTVGGALDALEVKADLAAEALAALEAKVDKINFDELIRIHIEEDMLLHDRISHFYLPEAFGGRLEMVSAIVFDTIIQNQAAGIDTGNALDSWNDGEAARAAGEWKDAWDNYVQAYRMVVTGG